MGVKGCCQSPRVTDAGHALGGPLHRGGLWHPPPFSCCPLLSSGQKSWASDHILLQLFYLVWSHSLLEIHSPTSSCHSRHFFFDRTIREKARTISRNQVKHCKFFTLFLNALCLPGGDMLRLIDNNGGQFFSFVFLQKERHPVLAISESSGFKGISKESPMSCCVLVCIDGLCSCYQVRGVWADGKTVCSFNT